MKCFENGLSMRSCIQSIKTESKENILLFLQSLNIIDLQNMLISYIQQSNIYQRKIIDDIWKSKVILYIYIYIFYL